MFKSKNTVIKLTNKDFKGKKLTNKKFKNKHGYVLFYAPWCPHCQSKEAFWSYLGNQFNHSPEFKNLDFRIGVVDVTDPKSKKTANTLDINAIPRFMHVLPDGKLKDYKGQNLSPEALMGAVCELSGNKEICNFDANDL